MATKDHCLFFKNKQDLVVNDSLNGQFNNLNLNQNKQYFGEIVQPSKNVVNHNKGISNYDCSHNNDFSQKSQNFASFGNTKTSSSFANQIIQKDYGKKEKEKILNAKSSTLSLHISAYENSIDATFDDSIDREKDGTNKKNSIKSWKAVKESINSSSSAANYAFELPRQQQQNQNNDPEVMQFKASQRLSNVNGESSSNNTLSTTITNMTENNSSVCQRLVVCEQALNNPNKKWGKTFIDNNSIIQIHPSNSVHLNHLKNVTITKSFFGRRLPERWITTAAEKGLEFNLQCLQLISSDITFNELATICENSDLEKIYLEKCNALSRIQACDIAAWSKFATKIIIDIKGMVFSENWLRYFMNRDGDADDIECFKIYNIPVQVIDKHDLERFLLTVSRLQSNVVTISFAKQIKAAKIPKLFQNVFKNVTISVFNCYDSCEKFIVHFNSKQGKSRSLYYVSFAALQTRGITEGMKRLET